MRRACSSEPRRPTARSEGQTVHGSRSRATRPPSWSTPHQGQVVPGVPRDPLQLAHELGHLLGPVDVAGEQDDVAHAVVTDEGAARRPRRSWPSKPTITRWPAWRRLSFIPRALAHRLVHPLAVGRLSRRRPAPPGPPSWPCPCPWARRRRSPRWPARPRPRCRRRSPPAGRYALSTAISAASLSASSWRPAFWNCSTESSRCFTRAWSTFAASASSRGALLVDLLVLEGGLGHAEHAECGRRPGPSWRR